MDLVIRNARIATCAGPERGTPAEQLAMIDRGAVAVRGDRIAWVGDDADAPGADRVIDARGRALLPGLVDPHTHLVFAGSRVDEFARKMAGEDYLAIAAKGGGIASTMRATRAASDDELFDRAAARARAMRACGTTTIEIKSGYGLSTHDELRILRAARRIEREGIARVTTTFLGAHTVPPEHAAARGAYVDEIVEQMIPAVVGEGLADACDVYCDAGAFTLDETRRILEAARCERLRVRAHVGQFADLGGAELLGEMSALSADHLEAMSDGGGAALARGGVVAVLLPGAWRTLRQTPPDVERLRRHGVPIAVGTDCNPGTSPCTDLPLCAALAVRDAGLTLEEALIAITSVAARAAGVAGVGRIAKDAHADLALYEHDDPRALAYALGGVRARLVVLGGRVVHENGPSDQHVW